MRETKTKIRVLKDIKIMIERYVKKYILIYTLTLSKSSIDIRTPFNLEIRNYVVILNPTLVRRNPLQMERNSHQATLE